MKRSTVVWDAMTLDQYVTDPQAFIRAIAWRLRASATRHSETI
jgi:cytochrome c2